MAKAVGITPTSSPARRLENIVLLQLLRSRSNSSDKIEVYFWEDVQKRAQLDFVVRGNDRSKLAIQVCYDITDPVTRDRELRAFALARLGEEQRLLLTSSHTEKIQSAAGEVHCMPVWRFLLEESGGSPN